MEAKHSRKRRRARQRDGRLRVRPWRDPQLTLLLAKLLAWLLADKEVERGGLTTAAKPLILLFQSLVLLLEERVLTLELDPAIKKQREGRRGRARAGPGLDAAQYRGVWGGYVVGWGEKRKGLPRVRVDRAGSLDLKLESPCCSYFSCRTRCTVGSAATLAESSSRSKSCESAMSSLIKLHASSSCSFVTTTADLHSAVELAKDTAAVPTPTASGAARLATACMSAWVCSLSEVWGLSFLGGLFTIHLCCELFVE